MIFILMLVIFIFGYIAIAFENTLKINKAAFALLTGVLCWVTYTMGSAANAEINAQLINQLGDIAEILFFLMGAMTIVELIDGHDGFDIIASKISVNSRRKLLWVSTLTTFFLSAALDNLTTTIVMVTFISKLISDTKIRLLFIGMIIIAANAGGAWSPIGDVTTTMLWIGGQVTATGVLKNVFFPSIVNALVPLVILSFFVKGTIQPEIQRSLSTELRGRDRFSVLITGIASIISIPFFRTLTCLPPFMGMLLVLGFLWVFTEILHGNKRKEVRSLYSIEEALSRIDLPSILFFLGLLMSVAALNAAGILRASANWLDLTIGHTGLIVLLIGILSSIVDNVPLVAATMGMYSLDRYPTDHFFWQFLSYCSGTGGSALIIGSAAGVAAMGISNINFFWYLKRITPIALLGFFAGAAIFLIR